MAVDQNPVERDVEDIGRDHHDHRRQRPLDPLKEKGRRQVDQVERQAEAEDRDDTAAMARQGFRLAAEPQETLPHLAERQPGQADDDGIGERPPPGAAALDIVLATEGLGGDRHRADQQPQGGDDKELERHHGDGLEGQLLAVETADHHGVDQLHAHDPEARHDHRDGQAQQLGQMPRQPVDEGVPTADGLGPGLGRCAGHLAVVPAGDLGSG